MKSRTTKPDRGGLLLVVAVVWAIVASCVLIFFGCQLSSADESAIAPHPDARFVAVADVPIDSCFADSTPALRSGQILIQRHLYTAAIDPEKRQPVWIAYTVSRGDWDTANVLSRNFHTPKRLQPFALEQSDYANSGYELGHLYGLQFVSAASSAAEVNEVCVIAAQRPDLNKGPWLAAENRIKQSSERQPVKVLAGQLWIDDMPPLKQCDERHRVASHCWMLFAPGPDGTEEAYRFPQTVKRSDDLKQFTVEPDALRDEISSVWTRSIQ